LLKETTGTFDGARTHNLHITNQTCNPQILVVKSMSFNYAIIWSLCRYIYFWLW